MDSTAAILLRRTRLTETSWIVTWLSELHGKIKTVAKGARRPKSKFAGLLDLFYEAEIDFARSRRSDLHILREVTLRDPREGLRHVYARVQTAAYFVELIELTTEPEHPVPEIYDLLRRALAWLEKSTPDRRGVLHFESELARLLGLGTTPSAAVALGRVHHRLPPGRAALLRAMGAAGRAKPIEDGMNTESPSQGHVAALFDTRAAADAAIAELETSGFDRELAQLLTGEDFETEAEMAPAPGILTPTGVGVLGPLGGLGGGLPTGVTVGGGGLWAANAYVGAMPQHDAHLRGEVSGGRLLVTVDAGQKAATARTILERNGGHTNFEAA